MAIVAGGYPLWALKAAEFARPAPCAKGICAVYVNCIYVYTYLHMQVKWLMALHIRDERAATLARRLASRRGVTMTDAVIGALEGALLKEDRPLRERLAEIATDARRLADPRRQRPLTKRDSDVLWGN